MKRVLSRVMSLIVGIVIVASLGVAAQAKNIYMAPWGSDNNDGSWDNPRFNLTSAAWGAVGGDTIYMRGGTYYPTSTQWVGCQGSPGNPVTIKAQPGEWPVFDFKNMSGSGKHNAFEVGEANFVNVESLELRNSPVNGFTVWKSKNIRVKWVSVSNVQGSGLFAGGGGSMDLTQYIRFEGCKVQRACLGNAARTAGSWPYTIGFSSARHVVVVNCTAKQSYGEGIGFTRVSDGWAENNYVTDCYSVGMYLDNAQWVTLKGNTIESTGDTNYYRSGYPFGGIQAANETYDGNYLYGNWVQNNKTNKCGRGFAYLNYGNYDAGMKNTTVSGNTFQNSVLNNVTVEYSPGNANNNIQSN